MQKHRNTLTNKHIIFIIPRVLSAPDLSVRSPHYHQQIVLVGLVAITSKCCQGSMGITPRRS